MLNLDLIGNGENFLALKESIGKYVDALEPHKKQFVELCLREDPKARPKANTLLKHPVLQEVATGPKVHGKNYWEGYWA